MTLEEAIILFGYHQRSNLKPRTVRSYHPLLQRFEVEFGDRSFDSIGSDEIFQFLERVLFDSSFESGIYNHGSLSFISP